MTTMNMPGFTAEHSLYRTEGHFHTGVSDTFSVFTAEIRPQLWCVQQGGGFICGTGDGDGGGGFGLGEGGPGSIPGPGPEPPFEAQCRSRCHIRFRLTPARLEQCLGNCGE